MTFAALGALFSIVGAACSVVILAHAFRQSLGAGVMVLCVPCFIFSYAFNQFDHPKKGLIVSGWLASLGVCMLMGAAVLQGPMPLPRP